jgi:phosphoribosylformylglycinamidine synthase
MKAKVIVTLKPTVLDPQGMTIQRNLESAGLADVTEIRQGKFFDVQLTDGLPEPRRREIVERLAREVLTNPVIEQYRIIWE